jgi:hypothetical protein
VHASRRGRLYRDAGITLLAFLHSAPHKETTRNSSHKRHKTHRFQSCKSYPTSLQRAKRFTPLRDGNRLENTHAFLGIPRKACESPRWTESSWDCSSYDLTTVRYSIAVLAVIRTLQPCQEPNRDCLSHRPSTSRKGFRHQCPSPHLSQRRLRARHVARVSRVLKYLRITVVSNSTGSRARESSITDTGRLSTTHR